MSSCFEKHHAIPDSTHVSLMLAQYIKLHCQDVARRAFADWQYVAEALAFNHKYPPGNV